MADLRKNGATSNLVRFTLKNSSTGVGLTGLTSASAGLIISTIADNEATATAYTVTGATIETIATLGTFAAPTATKCRFKEVDATNHPGLYEFQFADARFAVANAKRLVISVSGAASLLAADYEILLWVIDPFAAAFAANVTQLLGTAWLTPAVAGTPDVNVKQLSGDATAADNAEAFFDGTGYAGTGNVIPTVTTVNGLAAGTITAASIATGAVDADAIAADAGVEIAAAVWDRVLNAANHNISGSAGRRLRQLGAASIFGGTASAGASNSITLAGASATSEIYDGNLVVLVGGTGEGQSRVIVEYNGSTKVAIVDRAWEVNPDNTSEFEILADHQADIAHHGLAQAGGATSITLATTASATDDIYNGSHVFISTSGGSGQTRLITDYDGASRVATVSPAWATNPGASSVYKIIPVGRSIADSLAAGAIVAATFAAGAIDASAIAADAIGSSELAASAVTEIQSGLSTLDAAGIRTAVGLATANLDTQLTTIDDFLDTEVAAILAAVDTEVAAIKAKTDNLPASPAAVGSAMTLAADSVTAAALATDAVTEIVAGVAAMVIEGAVTLKQSLQLANAANAGKLSGAATTTVSIRDLGDTKNRVVGTVDADGNRSAVTVSYD